MRGNDPLQACKPYVILSISTRVKLFSLALLASHVTLTSFIVSLGVTMIFRERCRK